MSYSYIKRVIIIIHVISLSSVLKACNNKKKRICMLIMILSMSNEIKLKKKTE